LGFVVSSSGIQHSAFSNQYCGKSAMVGWIAKRCPSPIGVDIGSRSVKLLQFDARRAQVRAAARWDLPTHLQVDTRPEHPAPPASPYPASGCPDGQIVEAIRRARQRRDFRGREAVLCLGAGRLFVQNLRVAPASGEELTKLVHLEAAGRLPFPSNEAEIHYVEAADVRQQDTVRREVIVLACHRPVLEQMLAVAESAGLRPVAVDVEPAAMLRCYCKQFRRDDDQRRRMMLVSVGASTTLVVIARASEAVFIKYIDVGGRHWDEAVARHLRMSLADAAALRRHNGDRRAQERDPEIARSITESVRPVLDCLANELSLCLRYYSVTFRGQPLSQIVLGGGESTRWLADWLAARLNLPCELGDPLRTYQKAVGVPACGSGRVGQWDVAAGLALRER
jgi:type IV pilus assembly protein PilM